MERRLLVKAALAAALALATGGCGAEFRLPTERRENRAQPGDKTYQMIYTWTGFAGASDILLIPGPQLYIAFRDAGRVSEYSTTEPTALGAGRFPGVRYPAALAASPTSVFVLDQGDTAAARALRGGSWYELDCGLVRGQTIRAGDPLWNGRDSLDYHRIIVDLPQYWYVREYDLKGRAQKSAFTDTTFAWVNGIAADAQGRVYVSGVIRHCTIDIFNISNRTLDHEFRVYRYEPGTGDRFVVGGWKRSRDFGPAPDYRGIVEGTGIGFSKDPRGLAWSQVTGAALYFADRGNNEFQKYDLSNGDNSFKQDICDLDTTALVLPSDVSVDGEGNVYVLDGETSRRILRYDPDGTKCRQRVDIEPNRFGQPLIRPIAIAAGDYDEGEGVLRNFVYVIDGGAGQVVVYRRRV